MNVLFVTPGFPPVNRHFVRALRRRGATVLGVGDSPPADLGDELRTALADYRFVPSLSDGDRVLAVARELAARWGRIDVVESHLELWLGLDARLREALDVPGPRPALLAEQRSKAGMAAIFDRADVRRPPHARVGDWAALRALIEEHGYPIVMKPDTGAGAARTFLVTGAGELERALEGDLADHLAQPFVSSEIVTYDGLTDRDGRVVYATAHRYDTGIMQVVSGGLDGHYWSLRDLPPALEAIGKRAVAAFDVRGRFFHLELFDTPGGYVALEMNLRPPGGHTTDMMNFGSDIDVYDLWARIAVGEPVDDFCFERRYHVAHAGRRDGRRYRLDHAALVERLGDRLVVYRRLPREFSSMQGDGMYLLRSPSLEAVREAIALVQRRA